MNGCKTDEVKRLPVINIMTEDAIEWEQSIPCLAGYATAADSSTWPGKTKFRGGVSSKYGKHSYSLKFVDPHSLCNLPANRSWILNASYIDKTFMRHKICFDLFLQMGSHNNAPLCGYAMVQENMVPKGLYVVMQRLNKKVLRLNEADTGALIFKEPKVFYNDTELPSRSEGAQNYHEQKYPDFDQQDRNVVMDELRSFLLHASDEEFTNKVGTLFDLRNIADWHLLLLFTNNSDGLLKNFYLYKVDSSSPYRIAIWDYDHSFGRDGDNEPNMLERMADEHRNILFDRLLKSPSYKKALSERWKMLRRNNIFSEENIARMMTENDAYIRSGIAENTALWPIDAPDYFDGSDYEEEKERILQYVPLILDTLDRRFGYVNE
ncbi:MAG: CotH kinase family protein [Bacteroidales bacterium]|nr:CotH kinase family protein [Bacteroidales bacterium]